MRISDWSSDVCSSDLHFTIADRDHVIVEHALIDDIGLLSYKTGVRIAQAMQPRDRLGRLPGLPRRIFRRHRLIGCATTVDEQFQPGIAVVTAQADVIGRTFVAKGRRRGQRRGMREMATVSRSEEHTSELQSLMRNT